MSVGVGMDHDSRLLALRLEGRGSRCSGSRLLSLGARVLSLDPRITSLDELWALLESLRLELLLFFCSGPCLVASRLELAAFLGLRGWSLRCLPLSGIGGLDPGVFFLLCWFWSSLWLCIGFFLGGLSLLWLSSG